MGEKNARRAPGAIEVGDGRLLPRFRWWQSFSRSLFHLRLTGADGAAQVWSVDVRHGGDDNGDVRAELYLDGISHSRSTLPAAFPVPGGMIEVATSMFGLRRCHYVTFAGAQFQLEPDPASAEARRARLERRSPGLSRAIGFTSLLVLVFALVLAVPQLVEQITNFPFVAESVGAFSSPFHLPTWANLSLVAASLAASTERALRLRYNRILDGGLFSGDD